MRLFARSTPAPHLAGAVAFLAFVPAALKAANATHFFANLGGFAFSLALEETFRDLGHPGQIHTADYGNSLVFVVDGLAFDHTGLSALAIDEAITADVAAARAIGPIYARVETRDRDRRYAKRLIADAMALAAADAGTRLAA